MYILPNDNREKIEFRGVMLTTTPLAVLFLEESKSDSEQAVWLPESQIEFEYDNDGGRVDPDQVDLGKGGIHHPVVTVHFPLWLAEDKGLV